MLPKFAIAGLAATAFVAATALTPTGAAAGGRGGGAGNFPQYGTWNWPAYTETNCGYVRVNTYRQRQPGPWPMGLSVPLDLAEKSWKFFGVRWRQPTHVSRCKTPHILNTPNFVSGIGALSAAEKHKASTRRVSAGVMMPSSHSRAVA